MNLCLPCELVGKSGHHSLKWDPDSEDSSFAQLDVPPHTHSQDQSRRMYQEAKATVSLLTLTSCETGEVVPLVGLNFLIGKMADNS